MGFLHKIPRNYRSFAIIAMVVLGDLLLAVPTYFVYRYRQNYSSSTRALFNLTAGDFDADMVRIQSVSQINLMVRPSSVDFSNQKMTLGIHFLPTGTFASTKKNSVPDTLALPQEKDDSGNKATIRFEFGDLGNKTFTTGRVMGKAELTMGIFNGDISDFPFDNFQKDLPVSAWLSTAPDQKVPLGIFMDTTLGNYEITPKITPPTTSDDRTVLLSFDLKRANSVKAFTVFLLLMMFLISMTTFSMAIDVKLRHRKVDNLAMYTAFIFALPAMRKSLPDAPPIGVSIDVLVFFWAMIIAALAGVLSLTNFVFSYEDEKMKQRKDGKAAENVDGSKAVTDSPTIVDGPPRTYERTFGNYL